jgi:hypothetical protein
VVIGAEFSKENHSSIPRNCIREEAETNLMLELTPKPDLIDGVGKKKYIFILNFLNLCSSYIIIESISENPN